MQEQKQLTDLSPIVEACINKAISMIFMCNSMKPGVIKMDMQTVECNQTSAV